MEKVKMMYEEKKGRDMQGIGKRVSEGCSNYFLFWFICKAPNVKRKFRICDSTQINNWRITRTRMIYVIIKKKGTSMKKEQGALVVAHVRNIDITKNTRDKRIVWLKRLGINSKKNHWFMWNTREKLIPSQPMSRIKT